MVARIAGQRVDHGTAAVPVAALRVLLLASRFELPYRVLRCAQASGTEVYVLGNAAASPLRFSRHCKQFFLSEHPILGEYDPGLLAQISRLAHELSIEMLIPGDDLSMRSLIAGEGSLPAGCFPHPSLNHFDTLNNKWNFAALCAQIALPHPRTHLVAEPSALSREILACTPDHALIVKPLSLSGGAGIVVFDGTDHEERLRSIAYRPILVQEFIQGEDVCATLYARHGSIEAFIAYSYHRKTYTAYHDQRIFDDLDRLVRQLDLDGVYNFDIRVTREGALYYLECNPRFFHKLDLSMVAGVNFVAMGLPRVYSGLARMPAPVDVRLPEASMRSAPWRWTRRDVAMVSYFLSDPVPYLIEKFRLHLRVDATSNVRCYRPA